MRWLTSNLPFLQGRSAVELTLAFALGTFATCLFVFVPIVVVYLTGDLGHELENLDTRLGIALFSLLWLTTVVCTIGAVADVSLDGLRHNTPGRLVVYGIKWGAMDGCAVLFGLILVGLVAGIIAALVEGEPAAIIGVWLVALLVAIIGGAVAGCIGAFFGLVAALVELPLVYLARSISAGTE